MREIVISNQQDVTYFLADEQEAAAILSYAMFAEKTTTRTYHSKEIQQKARVLPMQIKHWTNTRVIIPLETVRGTGRAHIYDHQNLVEALICRELNKYSININVMHDTLAFLREKVWKFNIRMGVSSNSYVKSTVLAVDELRRQQDELFAKFPQLMKRNEFIDALDKKNYAAARSIIECENAPLKEAATDWLMDYEKLKLVIDTYLETNEGRYRATNKRMSGDFNLWNFFKCYPQHQSFFLVMWTESNDISNAHRLSSGLHLHVTTEQLDEIVSRCKSSIVINISNLLDEAGPFFNSDITNSDN